MALDLGAVVGRVVLEDVEFQRTYVRVVRQMSSLGAEAGKSASGAARLDESLAALSSSATRAGAGMDRAGKAAAAQAAAEDKAAVASQRHAKAVADVAAVMTRTAGATEREQQAALRLTAAQDRLNAAQESGVATTRSLASAQAGLVGAQRNMASASEAAAASSSRWRGALAGTIKTAASLGLLFGGIEAVKKSIDIAHEASAFQRDMLLVQTQAGASASDVKLLSAAVLNMAGDVAQAPEDLAVALYHIKSVASDANGAILSNAKMLDILRISAEGAKIGNDDLEQTTNALTSTVASGIGGVKTFSQAMGVLLATVGAGDMHLSDLNQALGTGLLARARVFGLTIQEVGASLAVFGDNNIRGADAATQLRMVFQDLAKPAAHADDVLSQIGLTAADLRKSLGEQGFSATLHLLSSRMTEAGITGNKMGGFLEDAFTKRAGAGLAILLTQLDRFDSKLGVVTNAGTSFDSKWVAVTQTASFAWDSLNASLTATGISIANNVLPQLTAAGQWLGRELPQAVGVLTGVLGGPLSVAWDALTLGFQAAAAVLGPVLSILDKFSGPLGNVATLALGVWAAFKVGAAIPGILDTIALRALYMGDSLRAGATTAVTSLRGIGASATVAGDEVAASGAVARVGWAGLLGPLAAVGVGIGLLVSMFHSSSHASEEAATAAKAYSDALSSSTTDPKSTIVGAIVKQLSDNNVPQTLDSLNSKIKTMGLTSQFSGDQFVKAIRDGGPALDTLRGKLEAFIAANRPKGRPVPGLLDAHGITEATKLLQDLNAQYDGLTAAGRKQIAEFKQFGTAAQPIADVAQKFNLTSDAATRLAGMLGLAVTKEGNLVDSTKANVAAIGSLSAVTNTASQSMAGFIAAWSTFAGTTGTAADRAALIGATLKAANGDALGFASSMNAAAQANQGFISSLRQQAAGVGKSGETMAALVRSVVNLKTGTIDYGKAAAGPMISGLQQIQTAAMNAAQATFQHARATMSGKNAADAAYKVYVGQTRGALIGEASQLGLTAGQAKKLADRYFGMPKKVKTLIESEGADPVLNVLNKIGELLAKVFHVKWNADLHATDKASPTIAGVHDRFNAFARANASPPLNVDDNASGPIGNVRGSLAALNGASASPTVSIYDRASGTIGSIRGSLAALNGQVATTYVNVVNRVLGPPIPHAGGTGPSGLPRGWSTVGEQGWEGAYTDDSGRTHIVPHAAAMKALNLPDRIPGYAGGTVPGFADGTSPLAAAISMVRDVIEAALHRDPTTVSGAYGSFQYRRERAVQTRTQSVEAYRAFEEASKFAALHKASDSAQKAAEKAKQAWQDLKSVADAAGQAAGDAASKLVDLTNAKVAAFADTVSGFRSGVAGGISGGVSLTSLYSDVGGDATAMAARAQKLLASAKAFNNDLHTLAKLGVSPSELAQVAALGAESGDAFAKQLIALGPTRIKALNASLDAINNTANAGAASLAAGFYGAGASALNSLVKGMQAHYPALKTALQPLVTQIAAMFHFTPIVTAPHYGGTSALPHHAAGGVNIGGWGMFGEHGPEIAWTPPHTSVWRHGVTPRGYDDDRILHELRAVRERLESIERTVPVNIAQTGAGLYERAGTKVASEMQRRIRAGRAQ